MTMKPSYEELERRVQELQESEIYYRTLFENVNDAVLVHEIGFDGKPGKFIDASRVALKRLGYTHDELLKLTPKDITTEKGYKDLSEARANITSNCAAIFETTHLARNGRPIPVESHVNVVELAGQRVAVSVVRDLSERKRAEEILRLSNEQLTFYRHAVDSMKDYKISVVDGNYCYRVVSSQYMEEYNLSEADLIGKSVAEVMGQDVFEKSIKSNLDKALQGHAVYYSGWFEIPSKGLRYMELSYYPLLVENRKSTSVVALIRDITERKQAEEALKETLQSLEFALHGGKLGMWDWNPQDGAVIYNDLWAQMLEYRPDEVEPTVEFFKQHVHPEDLAAVLDRLTGHLEGRLPVYESEHRFRTKSGRWLWVLDRGKIAERDKNGRPVRVTGLIADITERKEVEEALRKSEERFSLAMEASKDGIWDWDLTTGSIYCSPALTAMLGYETADVIGTVDDWQHLIHPEDRQKAYQANLDCVNNLSAFFEVEYRMKTREGGWKWILGRGKAVYRDSAGKALRMIGTHHDITERKQTEDQLRFQSLVLNQIQDRVTVTDLNGVITYVNDAEVRSLGYSREQLIGEPVKKYGEDPEQGATQQEIIEKTLKDGKWQGEVVNRTADGRRVVMDSRIQVVLDDQGNRVALAGISTDITARKQAEEEREKLREQLSQAQKMESVGRLAGGIAHDFNNMLGVILGHTELALLEADETHGLHEDLMEIQKAAKRSAEITKQLLAFARKQAISPRQLNLNDTVESMLNMLRRLIGEDIDLVWQPAAHLWPVAMDPSQIDQILANLCINARDAIDGVGKLTIETGIKSFDEAYCSEHTGFTPGDFVLLAVGDNGCGMDKDTLDNLFEPFFTTKEIGKGTGLGLATIYGIVKQNSGFINVYSEPGRGSVFKIYLPRFTAVEDPGMGVPRKKTEPGGTETILLVEDEPSILRMTRMMLERKGYAVIPAATPAEALANADTHSGPIDLLMTDVVMPEMNGRDLAEKITARYPGIRLLFMSGYTANVIAHHGVLDDGVAFIQKPFSIAEMAEKVREVLDKASDETQ